MIIEVNFIEQGPPFKNHFIAEACFNLIEDHGQVIIFFYDSGPEFQFAGNRGKNVFELFSID